MFGQIFLTPDTRDFVIRTCLEYTYDNWLVALSIVVAAFASYTSFHLVLRLKVATDFRAKWGWLAVGAFAMGSGIWSMHFIAMLAVQVPAAVRYDLVLTFVSMAFAVVASGIAFYVVANVERKIAGLICGGVFMGAGIGGMHYTGMAAIHMDADIRYDPYVFLLSVVVAVTLSTVALWLMRLRLRSRQAAIANTLPSEIVSAVVMGASIAIMHYTGMAATYFLPSAAASGVAADFGADRMAELVTFGTGTILFLSLIAAMVDQAFRIKQLSAVLNARAVAEIIENVGEAIVMFDESGRIERFNAAAVGTFGYIPEDIIGKPLETLFPSDQFSRIRTYWRSVGAGATQQSRRIDDLKSQRSDGSLFDIELSLSTMLIENETRFIAVCSDVTARREAEETLRKAKDDADAANRAKSEFLANMSHEIRTPMNGVIGMSELLLDTNLDDEQRQYASAVTRSAQALLTVINDVLDFSKLDAGRLKLEKNDFNTIDVVEDIAELLRPRAVDPGIDLVTFVAPSVPGYLRGDADRLRQVLLNLAGNAVKFTERGSVAITAAVARVSPHGVTLRYEVVDTGIGIPEEEQDRLFQRFMQVDGSATRLYGGTGLGLAICKQIVELMGGEIGVESKPGMGSTFWFTAPLDDASREGDGVDRPLTTLAGLRVLVVDDIALNRTIFEKQLASWGIDVECAEGGVQALAAIERSVRHGRPFDAAILDHAMPGMDGEELARRIVADTASRGIRLILASSLDFRKDADRLRAVGFAVCLCKPVRRRELFDTLAEVCSRTAGVAQQQPDGAPGQAAAPIDAAPKPMRILLAEDNRTNQLLVTVILKNIGYKIDVCQNGIEAVHAVRHNTYDLVLMDVNMPEMDGIAATAAIREMDGPRGRVPIIALTANAMEGDREHFLASGMDGYLSKPIDRKKLCALVEEIDSRSAARDPEAADESGDASADDALLDPAVIEDWLSFLSDEDFVAMLETQSTDARACMARIETALAAGAFESVGKCAHDLKSTAGAIGMVAVHRLAEQLERTCREGRTEPVAGLVEALAGAVSESMVAMDEHRRRVAA